MSYLRPSAFCCGLGLAVTTGLPASSELLDCYHQALPGKPYVLTKDDRAFAAQVIRAVRDEDVAEMGLVDMTSPEEPALGAEGPGTLFRDRMGDWVSASSVALRADASGQEVLLINLETPATCSNGNAACEFTMLTKAAPRRKLLDEWGHCIRLSDTAHQGLRDVVLTAVAIDGVISDRVYQFDGQAYALASTITVGKIDLKD